MQIKYVDVVEKDLINANLLPNFKTTILYH